MSPITSTGNWLPTMERSEMRISYLQRNSRKTRFHFWSTIPLLLVVATATQLDSAPSSVARLAPTCRSADSTGTYLKGIIEQIVSLSDSTSTVVRGALQLPQMSASSVTLVTQSQTCGKAATALDAAQGTVNANRTMYVFKLGTTRYAVFEVASPSSDFGGAGENFIWYFTNKWAFLDRLGAGGV